MRHFFARTQALLKPLFSARPTYWSQPCNLFSSSSFYTESLKATQLPSDLVSRLNDVNFKNFYSLYDSHETVLTKDATWFTKIELIIKKCGLKSDIIDLPKPSCSVEQAYQSLKWLEFNIPSRDTSAKEFCAASLHVLEGFRHKPAVIKSHAMGDDFEHKRSTSLNKDSEERGR